MVLRVTSNEESDKHKESDDVMVSLKCSLAESLGREPTKAEVKTAKVAMAAAVTDLAGAKSNESAAITLQLVQSTNLGGAESLVVSTAPCSTRSIFVTYSGRKVVTTLSDVRAKAKRSFPINADNGVRMYVGKYLVDQSTLVFIADDDA